jgi:hypothetical protein
MKYYLYISDAKVDTLLPQIPLEVKQKISAEIGVSIGVLTARIQSERATNEDRVSRLVAVERALRNHSSVGTLRAPARWIADTASAYLSHFDERKQLAFFVGRSGGTNFVLGGSAVHLIGHTSNGDVSAGWSYMPRLLETLEDVLRRGVDLALNDTSLAEYISSGVGHPDYPSDWCEVINRVQERVKGPSIEIEFLAKRLTMGPAENGSMSILATPLYVAMAD